MLVDETVLMPLSLLLKLVLSLLMLLLLLLLLFLLSHDVDNVKAGSCCCVVDAVDENCRADIVAAAGSWYY
jgi:hypothetical protein